MKIGILTIGNELMNGRIADTNASFIAREVNQQGWSVEAIMSVGDDFASIKNRLDYLYASDRRRNLLRRFGTDMPMILPLPRSLRLSACHYILMKMF